MTFLSFFFPKIISRNFSPVNEEIQIVEQFGRRSIRVGGIEQSGSMVEGVWRKALAEAGKWRLEVRKVLILGLGGGSAVKVINKFYPKAEILGVEIDPVMVKLGKKYLGLNEYNTNEPPRVHGFNLEIRIGDAFNFISHTEDVGKYFDLVLVDIYLGKDIPKELESKEFLRDVKKVLTDGGIAIFNRLRGRGKEKELSFFYEKLKKIFSRVELIDPLINRLFICGK